MLKKITFTHVLLSVLTVLVMIFGIYYYRNSYIGSTFSANEIVFQHDTLIVLVNPQKKSHVHGLEIDIKGRTSQGVDIDLIESGKLMQSVHFSPSNVEYKFQNDWYSDTCIILFRPTIKGSNEIAITHHFFTN